MRSRTAFLAGTLVGVAAGVYAYSVASRPYVLDAALDLLFEKHRSFALSPQRRPPSISEVRVRRSGCYGPCPEYSAILRRNGTVIVQAVSNTPLLGTVQGTIDFTSLEAWLSRIDFARFERWYPSAVDDTTCDLEVTVGRRHHKLTYGSTSELPPDLWATDMVLSEVVDGVFRQAQRTGR